MHYSPTSSEYKFHGNPLSPTGENTAKLPLFFLSLFEVLESLGYTVDFTLGHDLSGASGTDTVFLKRPLDVAQNASDQLSVQISSGSQGHTS
jgi:hypothetical protein